MINSCYIAEHVEFLLRNHDCVVVPGFGAFLCNYVAAHFDESRSDCLLPPARYLAFNRMITDSDGLLVKSVARKERISPAEAAEKLRDDVETLWRELETRGELGFGRLGIFYKSRAGEPVFDAAPLHSINGSFYGLRPLNLTALTDSQSISSQEIDNGVADVSIENAIAEDDVQKPVKVLSAPVDWRAYATGVVASLAVVITAILFVVSPIKINHEVHEAAIAPIPKSSEAIDAVSVEPIVSEILISAAAKGVRFVETDSVSLIVPEQIAIVSKQPVASARFNDDDSYCVVVASFPSKAQADKYLDQHSSKLLGILEKDSKYRVYAATAATYGDAEKERCAVGREDAWICRR